MATSTIPAMKAALRTQLAGRVGLNGVQISYGYPGPVAETEYLWLADVKGEQKAATIGTRARDERYTLTVVVYAQNSDPRDSQTPTERAFALMAEIESQLRTDPTVNGTVLVAQIEGPIELTEL